MAVEQCLFPFIQPGQTLGGLPDQDSFYDVVDCLEEQGIESLAQRHLNRKGTDLDLVEQFNIYEVSTAIFILPGLLCCCVLTFCGQPLRL